MKTLKRHWPVVVDWIAVFVVVAVLLNSVQRGILTHPLLAFQLVLSYSFGLGYALNDIAGSPYVGGMPPWDWRWLLGACTLSLLTVGYVLARGRLVRRVLLGGLVVAQMVGIWFSFLDMIGAVT